MKFLQANETDFSTSNHAFRIYGCKFLSTVERRSSFDSSNFSNITSENSHCSSQAAHHNTLEKPTIPSQALQPADK